MEAFTKLINAADKNIKFPREDMKDKRLPLLDCVVSLGKDVNLSIEVYRKPMTTGSQTWDNPDTTRLDSEGSLKHKGKTEGIDAH